MGPFTRRLPDPTISPVFKGRQVPNAPVLTSYYASAVWHDGEFLNKV